MKDKIFTLIMLAGMLTFIACSDMMDTESERVVYEDDHQLDNPNDSIYSVIGIAAQLQNIADSYVLLGELRGDLVTTDPLYATTELQDIANFNATAKNTYVDRKKFYAIINNCNYILERMDTSIVENITKVMLPEYAQVKTLRAWTYLQLALIYGKANYFTKPLLSVDDIGTANTSMDLDALASVLIEDLLPYAHTRALDYGTVDGWNSAEFFYPTRMLLGDLYLYLNDYQNAANMYYSLIYDKGITISGSYASYWSNPTRETLAYNHLHAYRNEVLCRIIFDSQLRSNHSQLCKLTYSEKPSLIPIPAFTNRLAHATHFHSDGTAISRYFNGDLRGCAEYGNGKLLPDAFGPATIGNAQKRNVVTKFYNNLSGNETDKLTNRALTSLATARPSTLYLRYAEALNRLGKHTAAFSVIKYGLKAATLSDTLKVDSNEVKNLPAYMDFSSSIFNGNIGTAARGCGLGIQYDRSLFVIPQGADSTEYVENAILDELATETCFEGNRFFDLLCVSHHRSDHPAFMAEKVSARFDNPKAMVARLTSLSEWFVKEQ